MISSFFKLISIKKILEINDGLTLIVSMVMQTCLLDLHMGAFFFIKFFLGSPSSTNDC